MGGVLWPQGMAVHAIFTFKLLAAALGSLATLGGFASAWTAFLNHVEERVEHVRRVMCLIILVVLLVEVGFYVSGIVAEWALFICLVSNLWGAADALLRFPA